METDLFKKRFIGKVDFTSGRAVLPLSWGWRGRTFVLVYAKDGHLKYNLAKMIG
ncbi:MAG: hypothetical protein JNJ78_12695 [Anaerolineae bacterium]|nr:hypothetical protein [Anaerolineae bacterium]